jgi:hypothetical protein
MVAPVVTDDCWRITAIRNILPVAAQQQRRRAQMVAPVVTGNCWRIAAIRKVLHATPAQ